VQRISSQNCFNFLAGLAFELKSISLSFLVAIKAVVLVCEHSLVF